MFMDEIPVFMVGGWPTPLKNDGVSNSWDYDIPNINGKSKFHGSSQHQPVIGFKVPVPKWYPLVI